MTQVAAKPAGAVPLPTWPDEVYRVLKDAGVKQVAMVPDAGHSRLIRSFEADPETRVVTLTTEEEGVAMLAGAWLGGGRCGVTGASSTRGRSRWGRARVRRWNPSA